MSILRSTSHRSSITSSRFSLVRLLIVSSIVGGTSLGCASENSTPAKSEPNSVPTAESPEAILRQETDEPKVEVSDADLQESIDLLSSDYFAVRVENIKKLGESKPKPDSKELIAVLEGLIALHAQEFNDYEDSIVDQAIQQLGEPALQQARVWAKSDRVRVISKSATIMRSLGGEQLDTYRDILDDWFQSGDGDKKWAALFVLENAGPPAKVYLEGLKQHIHSSDFQIQQIALRVLAAIGPEAMPLLDQVRELIEDGQNISVKSHAAIAAGNIAVGSQQATEVAKQLADHLDDFNFVMKQRCLIGLIALKDGAKPVADQAKELMEHDTTGLAAHAAYVYAVATDDWEPAVTRLAALTDDLTVGFDALLLLKQAGTHAKPVTADLLRLTLNSDESISGLATEILAKIYAQPEEGDADFDKVVQRFRKMAEADVNEVSYMAQQQLELWKENGVLPETSTEESK